jgi:hypothetical protein
VEWIVLEKNYETRDRDGHEHAKQNIPQTLAHVIPPEAASVGDLFHPVSPGVQAMSAFEGTTDMLDTTSHVGF